MCGSGRPKIVTIILFAKHLMDMFRINVCGNQSLIATRMHAGTRILLKTSKTSLNAELFIKHNTRDPSVHRQLIHNSNAGRACGCLNMSVAAIVYVTRTQRALNHL